MNRKKIILILIFIVSILFFTLLYFLKMYLILMLCILMESFLMILFIKLYLNINILNIKKIINIINNIKIKRKLCSNEEYLKKITIETFDGSNSTTHPCVVKFDNSFNKYKYYMVHTPYDNHNVNLENPTLCVSNDGLLFKKIKNCKNPLLPLLLNNDKNFLKYYSDNFIFYDDDELQIWYRYTEENKSTNPYELKNKLYRIVSKDGINFSEPELIIEGEEWYLSPSIIKNKNLYYLYYFESDYKMYCKTSKDLKSWSKRAIVNIDFFDGKLWHGEVKKVNNKIYLLFLSKDYNLYLCETNVNNPINFDICNKIKLNYYDQSNFYGNDHPYKSSFLIDDEYIILYIPFVVNKINYFKIHGIIHRKWTMTYTKLKKENFAKYMIDKTNI